MYFIAQVLMESFKEFIHSLLLRTSALQMKQV